MPGFNVPSWLAQKVEHKIWFDEFSSPFFNWFRRTSAGAVGVKIALDGKKRGASISRGRQTFGCRYVHALYFIRCATRSLNKDIGWAESCHNSRRRGRLLSRFIFTPKKTQIQLHKTWVPVYYTTRTSCCSRAPLVFFLFQSTGVCRIFWLTLQPRGDCLGEYYETGISSIPYCTLPAHPGDSGFRHALPRNPWEELAALRPGSIIPSFLPTQ